MKWLLDKVQQWWAKRKWDKHVEALLQQCGCVCYCSACQATLNDQLCEAIEDGLYRYTCRCGKQSLFDYTYPVPVIVKSAELPLGG